MRQAMQVCAVLPMRAVEALDVAAARDGKTRSALIRELVERWLDPEGPRPPREAARRSRGEAGCAEERANG